MECRESAHISPPSPPHFPLLLTTCIAVVCVLQLMSQKIFYFLFIYLFWLRHSACGILVPRPGIEPAPPAVEAQNLNHWTIREVPKY